MDKDIKLGAEGDLDIQLVNGQLILTFKYTGASGVVALSVGQDIKYFLEKVKALLPANVFVDGAIGAIEAGIALVP